MIEILSRGRISDDDEWVYGYYVCLNCKSHRIYTGFAEVDCGTYYPDVYTINPETVGRYTGFTDKNSTKIFEGDIVEAYKYGEEKHIKTITFRNGCFYFGNWNFAEFLDKFRLYKVIGNIHDNPELLEENK